MRANLNAGLRLDVNQLTRGRRRLSRLLGTLTYSTGYTILFDWRVSGASGTLTLEHAGIKQSIALDGVPRRYGGRQWYAKCPRTGRRVSVLWRPPGATRFASRHAWGRSVAYGTQFLDACGRAHATQARIKRRLLGDHDPNDWDLPPKPKWMRWRTYQDLEDRFDRAEAFLDDQFTRAAARLLGMDWPG